MGSKVSTDNLMSQGERPSRRNFYEKEIIWSLWSIPGNLLAFSGSILNISVDSKVRKHFFRNIIIHLIFSKMNLNALCVE